MEPITFNFNWWYIIFATIAPIIFTYLTNMLLKLSDKKKNDADTQKTKEETDLLKAQRDKTASETWKALYDEIEEKLRDAEQNNSGLILQTKIESAQQWKTLLEKIEKLDEEKKVLEKTVVRLEAELEKEKRMRKKTEVKMESIKSWFSRNGEKLKDKQLEPFPEL